MKIHFYKYQGTGNDFIMINNFHNESISLKTSQIQYLCHRKFGIGADGIILIQKHHQYDFEMIYYNADGSQSLCGNGSRCAVLFASDLGIIKKQTSFLAIDGPHVATISDNLIHLRMNEVHKVEKIGDDYFIDTGSPHYVTLIKNLDQFDVYGQGKAIRNNAIFKDKGTNVNFVEVNHEGEVYVRTYERGVEDETLSCGTGVTAVALALSALGYNSPIKVITKGGALTITYNKETDNYFKNIILIGPAQKVFEGEVWLK